MATGSMDLQAWRQRWQEGRTGWNLGEAHPYLAMLCQRAQREAKLPAQGKIYVPGCGHGHEAAFMALNGYEVRAVDFAEEAIGEARQLYGELAQVSFEQADAIEVEDKDRRQFDGIVDRAMLCALAADKRQSYLAACHSRLKPGGLFLAILFAEVNRPEAEGPPFALSEEDIWTLFSSNFKLVAMEKRPCLGPSGILAEWLVIWRSA